MHTFSPVLTSSPSNANDGFNNSWIGVDNSVDRKLFAQVVYDINDTKGNYSATSTPKIVNLDKTSIVIFKSNPDRKVLFLQNIGKGTALVGLFAADINIQHVEGVGIPQAVQWHYTITPNEKVSDSLYTGPITVSSIDNTTLLYWEA